MIRYLAAACLMLTAALPAMADKPGFVPLDLDIALDSCLADFSPESDAAVLYEVCEGAMRDAVALHDVYAANSIGVPIAHDLTAAWQRAVTFIEERNSRQEAINMIGPEFWAETTNEACAAAAEAYAEESGSTRGMFEIISACKSRALAERWLSVSQDAALLCSDDSPGPAACASQVFPLEMKGRCEETDAADIFHIFIGGADIATILKAGPDNAPFAATDEMRVYVDQQDAQNTIVDWAPIYEAETEALRGVTANVEGRAAVTKADGTVVYLGSRVPWTSTDLDRRVHMVGVWAEQDTAAPIFTAAYTRFQYMPITDN